MLGVSVMCIRIKSVLCTCVKSRGGILGRGRKKARNDVWGGGGLQSNTIKESPPDIRPQYGPLIGLILANGMRGGRG